jgi:hypothetical protein
VAEGPLDPPGHAVGVPPVGPAHAPPQFELVRREHAGDPGLGVGAGAARPQRPEEASDQMSGGHAAQAWVTQNGVAGIASSRASLIG